MAPRIIKAPLSHSPRNAPCRNAGRAAPSVGHRTRLVRAGSGSASVLASQIVETGAAIGPVAIRDC
jgi:hypothetical protein